MGLSDRNKTSGPGCVACNARILVMAAETAVLDAADAVKDGTLAHYCWNCNELFCLRCVISSPVPGRGHDPGAGLTIADILVGEVAFTCPKCGAAEVRAVRYDKQPDMKRHDDLSITANAAFSYGVETARDKYTILIREGDPYPAPDPAPQVFYTSTDDQRIFRLPFYAGANLDRASTNKKEGEFCAVLPGGLPGGTPISVKVWLDHDGILCVSAHLEDDTNLDPWQQEETLLSRGESDDGTPEEPEGIFIDLDSDS